MWKLHSALVASVLMIGASVACAQGTTPPVNNTQNTQAGITQGRQNAANQSIFGRIKQTPWFMDQAIRAQLRINEDQAKRLNDSYAQFWSVYHRNTQPFNTSLTLSDAQRQSMLTSSNQFYVDFGRSANDILSPEQRVRFSQLTHQYRGFGSLYDPKIAERLKLSTDQLTQLRRYENDYHARLAEYYKSRTDNPKDAALRFDELRNEVNERIQAVLTQEQRQAWKEMVGEPYSFRIR